MLEQTFDRAGLREVYEKVLAGERLSFADGMRLYETPDLNAVGYLANLVRERWHGNQAYYVRNQHINYTNICTKACRFCSFYVRPQDPRAYCLTPEQVQEKIRRFLSLPLAEVHIVGGVNPKLPYEYYLDLVRAVKEVRPGVQVKAYTMIEIEQIARVGRKTVRETLLDLKAAGVEVLPGGGAEVFAERVHAELFPAKAGFTRWLEIARVAHEVGLFTNATLLYGHVEQPAEKVQHFLRLREVQDETGGFLAFLPLSWHPENTALSHLPGPTGVQDLREIAVARLMLDNFPHIKSFWVMNTPSLTQVALWYGVDDVDGSVLEYEITRDPETDTQQVLTQRQLVALIREAGREPVERDAVYNIYE
ncbi:MAG TPA: aminofutalosine synthase MqnE [Armatimonadetes bacterium]|nr:aminofutalosine synthase MqnE [Armatimonadota bacterium]